MRDKILWVGMTVLLLLTPWATQAQEDGPSGRDRPSERDKPAERDEPVERDELSGQDAPSLEFLEFLGDWETEDGQWTDPAEFEVPLPEQEIYGEENEPKEN